MTFKNQCFPECMQGPNDPCDGYQQLYRENMGLKHNLQMIKGYLQFIDERHCTKAVWDKLQNALEYAEN